MLTRTDEHSDFAADVSIFSNQLDPATGGRRLEELVFEVRNTERHSSATEKARRLAERGVRRVFYVHVRERQVAEWGEGRSWRPLGQDEVIEDRCLIPGLPVRAILDAAAADEAVAAALLRRGTRTLTEALAKQRAEGRAEGEAKGEVRGRVETARDTLLRVLSRRGFVIPQTIKARIAEEAELSRLQHWLDAAITADSVDDVFGDQTDQ